VILLEGYDLALARFLVSGVDVWLNLPEYPMEACGTSGQKAGINGVVNLSILDGWWPEGYNGENGWAIEPHTLVPDPAERNRREANELLDLLEEEVIPAFYDRSTDGLPTGWIRMSKASMRTLLPQFNSMRMVIDYVERLYAPAIAARSRLLDTDHGGAAVLAAWKRRVQTYWHEVHIHPAADMPANVRAGDELTIRITASLGPLAAEDVVAECLVGTRTPEGRFEQFACYRLAPADQQSGHEVSFSATFVPPMPGKQHYVVRIYPYHRLLCHPYQLGLMKWL